MDRIEHVSDTALMVAACRAIENDRPDGLIRDPFASVLAGDKGMVIARSSSAIDWMCFGLGARTRFVDDLVLQVIEENSVRTVVNLGAGLDTRPWRMNLPQNLRWIEVDFPAMLDYKTARLGNRPPVCQLERIPADLSNPVERGQVLETLGSSLSLMITEGLLMYLSRQSVAALASEPPDQTGVRWWIADLSAIALMRHAHGDMAQAIESVRAENHLETPEILNLANGYGWKTAVFRSYVRDAALLARERILKMMASGNTPPDPPPSDDPSGVYLFEH